MIVKGSPVFDAMIFIGKPRFIRGLLPMRLDPAEKGLDAAIGFARTAVLANAYACFDLEGPWDGRPNDVAKFFKSIRDAVPAARFGVYGYPDRQFWIPVNYATSLGKDAQHRAAFEQWTANNDRDAQLLSPYVQYVHPSLYTFYKDQAGWEIAAYYNIAEARKWRKPVVPFICPAYHDAAEAEIRSKPLPVQQWRAQLEFLTRHADGLVIWGIYKEQWNAQAEWWKETINWGKSRGINIG